MMWQWIKNKFGRIVTTVGFALQGADLDISPIRPSLELFLSHQAVEYIVAALLILSWSRHHYVALQHPG